MSRRQSLHPYTALINKNQKIQSKKMILDAIKWLAKKFPCAFDNKTKISPLKKGIMNDVLTYCDEAEKDGISKSKLRQAVVIYTRRLDYLTCLKAQGHRIDLNGTQLERVTDEEAQIASAKIKRRIEKILKNSKKGKNIKKTIEPSKKYIIVNSNINANTNLSYINQNLVPKNKQNTEISIKKQNKNFDPQAIAKFKEKLGLSKKNNEIT